VTSYFSEYIYITLSGITSKLISLTLIVMSHSVLCITSGAA